MEAGAPISIEILIRLAAAVVGGLLATAGAFKLISAGEFHGWLARLLGSGFTRPVRWLANIGIAVEFLLGAALLLFPTRSVLIFAWWFCLALVLIQLVAWRRKIGPCACFGASGHSEGAMLGPILAPVLLAVVSVLLWAGLRYPQHLTLWEVFMLAGSALAFALTLLILIEAPRRLEEIKAETQQP